MKYYFGHRFLALGALAPGLVIKRFRQAAMLGQKMGHGRVGFRQSGPGGEAAFSRDRASPPPASRRRGIHIPRCTDRRARRGKNDRQTAISTRSDRDIASLVFCVIGKLVLSDFGFASSIWLALFRISHSSPSRHPFASAISIRLVRCRYVLKKFRSAHCAAGGFAHRNPNRQTKIFVNLTRCHEPRKTHQKKAMFPVVLSPQPFLPRCASAACAAASRATGTRKGEQET